MYNSPARVFARLGATRPATAPSVIMGRAVVLGASVAGLLAARVLAEHAEHVLVVDRDELGAGTAHRAGVPQGTQMHVLLPAGRDQIDRWFPGFSREAVAEGAVLLPAAARRSYLDGRRKVPGSDVDMIAGSRPFLEGLLRRRTLALPNVTLLPGRVTSLDFAGAAVTGVRHDSAAGPIVTPADFVVDATGRSSRLGDWLEQGGWERPPMRRMAINLHYATATFRRSEEHPVPVAVLAGCTAAAGGDIAGAAFSAIEGDRWIVMLGSYGEGRPGRDPDDLVRRCREDFPPEFARVVANEMLGPVRTYRQADSRRRDFHRLRRLPAGLVAVGDAVSSFNPIYGQGMSSAALHASCLSEYLRSGPDLRRPAREFLALQRVVVDAAWGMSTSADLARPSVPGPRPPGHRISRWVADQITAASVTDPVTARRFDAVVEMRRHPNSLAAPRTLLRAVRVNQARER
ncbi:2-polyprenyl-6-methoxyphenol hydroxylase [Micromonospora purpureochromogenes]|uniref:2-polyprenyl-6-methoxyphenol hydroxylase n=1 Tax=Micromonospora purpureochromogenes TaxID=47872 RepID=A0A1C4ZNV8_9ACTN|nr:FAD-dependent monooxygenase [Micromonospora purpureochromogenes]SCF34579.1 2-polyprenyl-6-methoxyphenol hydroxylase [Micromonospora purpureochromogenes]